MAEMKFNLFVVGAAKTGTTWLYNYFKAHDDIFVPDIKEINHFNKENSNLADYQSLLKGNASFKYYGDISPLYFHDLSVAKKIHEYNSDSKIVIILRSPLDRAYSHYYMRFFDNRSSDDIDQEFRSNNRFINQGLYWQNIQSYLQCFDRKQICILFFEDFKHNKRLFLEQLNSFLSIKNEGYKEDKKINIRYGKPRFNRIYEVIKPIYYNIRNSTLFNLIKPVVQPLYRKLLFKDKSKVRLPQLEQNFENQIKGMYLEELEKLSTVVESEYIEKYKRDLA